MIHKAEPSAVVNALSNFKSKTMSYGDHKFLLDKSGMKHILERHHPSYWNGTIKKDQIFFDMKMSINDITKAVISVMFDLNVLRKCSEVCSMNSSLVYESPSSLHE